MAGHRKTGFILGGVALAMLGLGFSAKPLYNKFCQVTGFGGTVQTAQSNESEILDRTIRVYFDANVAPDLAWKFTPEQNFVDLKVGQSGLAYYKVKNFSKTALTGTATYNVAPIKAAPFFIKTECFCFTEQRIEAGQEMIMPVLFHVDSQIDDERRLDDIRDITLSYTFFKVENPTIQTAAQSREALN